ncbi:hypothetical protein TVNIR_0617 [Thioalkalivibrio nitratireducens DSM 14787]|uniref:Uncharacterized protein n=1 Tax=Thioalkalivibrio nitratireducens (strain DSM 14787 / UNIQEM 213 / ALEN2) TaxID=1255043 RepID=L0DTJ3_THIND|nr:hypothetical protein TVNIR_0617 [Thioalkalivibrio nitratireducens DSM 14787]
MTLVSKMAQSSLRSFRDNQEFIGTHAQYDSVDAATVDIN